MKGIRNIVALILFLFCHTIYAFGPPDAEEIYGSWDLGDKTTNIDNPFLFIVIAIAVLFGPGFIKYLLNRKKK